MNRYLCQPIAARVALIALAAIAASGSARACEFCNCLLAINPHYTSADRIVLTVMRQLERRASLTTGTSGRHDPLLRPLAPGAFGGSAPRLYHGTADATTAVTTFELAAEYHLGANVMITALLPVGVVDVRGDAPYAVRGLGDPMVMAHYIMPADLGAGSRMTVLAGAGFDLPIGAADLRTPDGDRLASGLQPGSGAADVLATLRASVQTGRWVFAADALGRIATGDNDFAERRGASADFTATASHELYRSNQDGLGVVGTVGVRGETTAADRGAAGADNTSKHTSAFVHVGGQILYDHLRLTASASIPAFESRASGEDRNVARIAAALAWEF